MSSERTTTTMTIILMLMKSKLTCWPPTSQSPARDLQMMTMMVMMMMMMVMAGQQPTKIQSQGVIPILLKLRMDSFWT